MEANTSSYPKPEAGGFLSRVQKWQGVESNALAIQKQQIDLVNQGYTNMIDDLNSLGPNPTAEQLVETAQRQVQYKRITPQMADTFIKSIPTDPSKIPEFRDNLARTLTSRQEQIHNAYGTPGFVGNGQQTTPVRQGLRGGPVAAGAPIQNQAPPTTPTVDPNTNQPALLGPQNPQLPEGASPSGLPGQFIPPNKLGGAVQPRQSPTGPVTAPTPLFDTGKAQYVADQELATQKLTAIKPMLQAVPYLKDLRSGSGTSTWNNALAFLKANGIINIEATNDPTAVYQEVNKKLSQYINQTGSRSDAALANKEESSPSAKTQISPALIKLVHDQIALDRVEAARAGAFKGQNFAEYGKHKSEFPNRVDERAFGLDLVTPEERASLVQKEAGNLKSKDGAVRQKAERFFKSLRIAKEQGFYAGE